MPKALTDPWTLAGRTIANRLVLAPLAGIGNWFVRLQARRYGAGLVVSEMVSSFGLAHRNERTLREFLRIHPDEHPVALQLFGHDPDVMREAAAIVADAGADLIDLNMGCPVRKVCKTGAGAASSRRPAWPASPSTRGTPPSSTPESPTTGWHATSRARSRCPWSSRAASRTRSGSSRPLARARPPPSCSPAARSATRGGSPPSSAAITARLRRGGASGSP